MISNVYEFTLDGRKYRLYSDKISWDDPGSHIPRIKNKCYVVPLRENDNSGFAVEKWAGPLVPAEKLSFPLVDELAEVSFKSSAPHCITRLLYRVSRWVNSRRPIKESSKLS